MPKILRNPEAQAALNICKSVRANCARTAEQNMPPTDVSFLKKGFPWHLTAKMRDSSTKILDCEQEMQNCVIKKSLPHRTQKR